MGFKRASDRFGTWMFHSHLLVFILGLFPVPLRAADRTEALASQVTIRRDTFGVPHILAQTEEAAAYGQGYAAAEDHCRTMGRLYLQARGELAAHFGERFAEDDFKVKQLHMHQGAAEGYARMPPWVQRILDGYAAGYNRYVAQHRAELPDWVKPASGVDILAHGRRVMLLEFSMDLRQLDKINGKVVKLPGSLDWDLSRGSNMWAIGKERSASGKGLLLGNPHLGWGGSQIFWESHLTVPGKINAYGTTLIGGPGVSIGFNENLGWSHTVNLHDSEDVYELTLDPKDHQRYLYDGSSVPLRKEEISIQVKTDAGLVTRKKDLYWSHYGPVLKWNGDRAYALKSSNMDEYRFAEEWNRMGKARNLAEFRSALDMQALPMFNICYADKEGNCFYLFNGRFPARPAGYQWEGVVPGNTSATEWSHILPQSRLPQLLNPPGGYVQNCNSAPWYTNARQIIDRHQFPNDLTPNFNSLRTQLSLEMLEGDGKITLDKVLRYKFNTKLLLADRVKPDLIKIARDHTVDGVSLDEAAKVLEAWDNTAARESKGALLFVSFWMKYGKAAAKPYAQPWDERAPTSTPSGIGEPETALQALAAAVKELRQKFGSLSVAWGDVHRLRRGKMDVPMGGFISEYQRDFRGDRFGDFGAFRVISYEPGKDGKMVARGGDSFILAVEFTSPPTAYSIVAYSQSDDPRSPHYTDQSVLFAAEKWKRAWFTEADIARNLERAYQP
jgi:acyl-homoserine-lactone acylase